MCFRVSLEYSCYFTVVVIILGCESINVIIESLVFFHSTIPRSQITRWVWSKDLRLVRSFFALLLAAAVFCRFRQTEEDLQTGMHKILDHVKDHEDAWPFIDPVEEEYAPNYYSIIRKPMDLQKMEERLDAGHYRTFSKFRSDFQLIVDNCRLYNGAENGK